ncbi:hypothetical protein BD780_001561 [Clostridium tetanomorphum]|uniref:DUF1538 domain-containing protein n=1 Tax=Clostridium tetanomorphum TaxID=1553 RepID=A0A923E5H8_CLOTT|nr:DUF1538 domain-containing protein [Clostridium tetanomorphum]KAJ52635.1 membrane spanning protein [Clostridium tetanomorphum DSM 665]MBC2396810.1 DUF1538 domain-containing protein [Clostridium tetanomorphum]MBP1863228.1 hypothetical protein [Clostridium tetanomorphum]NRS84336.1 hypothetical protein [Clostridium tetanomorphum]NRZ97550.1 hypothetical protein [Clostridium tetanomorphum]
MKILYLLKGLWDTFKSILPVTLFLVFIQIFLFKKPLKDVKSFTIGIILSVVGLFLFIEGTSLSLLPLGESVGENFVSLDNKWSILLLVFFIGFCTTLVEPALSILAMEIEEVSIGAIPTNTLICTVALGFATGLSLGIYKIIYNVNTSKIVVPLLIMALVLCFIAPQEIIGIAFDCASSTTGPVNIPLNLAIALGLSKVIEGSDPLLNGFGIIGLTSLGPVISVLLLGIITRKGGIFI